MGRKKIDDDELKRLQECFISLNNVAGAHIGMANKRPTIKQDKKLILSARLEIKNKEKNDEHS